MKLSTSFAAVLGFSVISTSASAISLTAYTDRTAWETAVSSFMTENFESFPTTTSYEFSPVDVGDFTVSTIGSTFGTDFHNIGPDLVTNDVNGSSQLNAATGTTLLDFDFSIFAFGADWDGPSNGTRVTSFVVDGESLAVPNLQPGFFGFVADTAFDSFLLDLTAGPADGFGLDNAVYAPATMSAVPIPTAAFLFAPALLGFLGFRRKVTKS